VKNTELFDESVLVYCRYYG